MDKTFDELNELRLWDFRLDSFGTSEDGDDVLSIFGATSPYVTAAAVRFHDVQFISAPTMFHHAHFRGATPDEVAASRRLAEFDCDLFAIDVDDGEYTFFIAATSASITFRENQA